MAVSFQLVERASQSFTSADVKSVKSVFCRDMCVAENTLRGASVELSAYSGQLRRTKLTEENAELRRLAKKAEAAQARTAEELQAFREKTSLDRYLLQSYLADELEAHRTAKQVRKQRRRAALENAFRRRVESKLEILANIAQALEKTRAALDDGIDEPGEQELAKHREELDALIAAVRQREAQVRTRSIQRYETALRVLRANPSAKAKAELGEAFDSLRKLLEK